MSDADLLDDASRWLATHAACLDRAAEDAETHPDPRVAPRIRLFAHMARSASRITGQGSGIPQTTTDRETP